MRLSPSTHQPFLPPPHAQVPVGKQHDDYNHPLIHIYLLKRRKQPLEEGGAAADEAALADEPADAAGAGAAGEPGALAPAAGAAGSAAEGQPQQAGEAAVGEQPQAAAAAGGEAEGSPSDQAAGEAQHPPAPASSGGAVASSDKLKEQFQTRRQGAMLARALARMDVKG